MLKARNPPLGLDSKFEKYRAEAISKVEELHKSPYVDGSLESASELGKEVKGLIKDWELAWLSCFGGKAVADIVKKDFLGDLYHAYNEAKGVKGKIQKIEDKWKKMAEAWEAVKGATAYSQGAAEKVSARHQRPTSITARAKWAGRAGGPKERMSVRQQALSLALFAPTSDARERAGRAGDSPARAGGRS